MAGKKYEGWHFVAVEGRLRDDSRAASVGGIETFDGKPELCAAGLHACKRAIDALNYAPGAYVRRVRLQGVVVGSGDKRAATRRVILAEADATRTLHLFACDEAERALLKAKVEDKATWNLIKTKRLWLDGKVPYEELAAARYTARLKYKGSWSIAQEAACSAAMNSAWKAAKNASWSAASEVAKVNAKNAKDYTVDSLIGVLVWSDAWTAERDAGNERLEAALNALFREGT